MSTFMDMKEEQIQWQMVTLLKATKSETLKDPKAVCGVSTVQQPQRLIATKYRNFLSL